MNFKTTSISDLVLIEPKVFGDQRGFFKESYSQRSFSAAGIEVEFVQDNVSRSRRGVLRGLHYQAPHTQGKLVSVLEGEVYDVAVDIRPGSPSFGQWEGFRLSADNHRILYVPPGFAHGFLTLSESALFCYKCSDVYHPECEHTIAWDDPAIAVQWPEVEELCISAKDQQGVALAEADLSALEFSL